MGILDKYFPMGLGTSRLPIRSPVDTEGVEKSAQLILAALDAGVNYIDTAYPYAAGGAHPALKLALGQTDKPYAVTVKVIHQSDKSADEARHRVESQLKSLGVDRAAFFVCWCIPGYGQFREIMQKGGVYDGAIRLKDEGLIDHICCSLHAPAEDAIKIIGSGAFAAVTVSFNLSNAISTLPILDAAQKHKVDVAVMNPLGGGGIAQNPDFFSFSQGAGENTVTAALRFAGAHPAVKIVLSGLNNAGELAENLIALTEKSPEPDAERLIRVTDRVKDIDGFCVNCHYCEGCPAGIPVAELMNKRNRLLFGKDANQDCGKAANEADENATLFYGQAHIEGSGEWFPASPANPCTRCGTCEKKCTQKLGIIDAIADIYHRASRCGFSLAARKDRLSELLHEKGHKRVGLYPKDRFADLIIKLYRQFFGDPDFAWVAFNSDPAMWGKVVDGLVVHGPSEIPAIKPDVIIVGNYRFAEDIYNDLRHFETEGIKIVKLHRETDVPWVF